MSIMIYLNALRVLQVQNLYDSMTLGGHSKWYDRYTTRQSRRRSLKNKRYK